MLALSKWIMFVAGQFHPNWFLSCQIYELTYDNLWPFRISDHANACKVSTLMVVECGCKIVIVIFVVQFAPHISWLTSLAFSSFNWKRNVRENFRFVWSYHVAGRFDPNRFLSCQILRMNLLFCPLDILRLFLTSDNEDSCKVSTLWRVVECVYGIYFVKYDVCGSIWPTTFS